MDIIEMTEADFVDLYGEFQAQQEEGEGYETFKDFLEGEGYDSQKVAGEEIWYERERQ